MGVEAYFDLPVFPFHYIRSILLGYIAIFFGCFQNSLIDIRIRDEKLDYGEEAGEEMILHYTKDRKLVKIELLDTSKTVIEFLEPILSQKPLAKAMNY